MTAVARNIVVLGARSDIGSILIREAGIRRGTRVMGISRSRTTEGKSGLPVRVEWIEGIDLTVDGDLQRLAKEVARKFREPFSVVHSVGDFWVHKPLVDTSFDDIRRMLESQILTLFGVARYLTPVMLRNGGGRLVAFSCNSVAYNYPDMAPFTASKGAVETFIKCYANEHAESGISATALALPTIRTKTVLKEKRVGDHKNYIRPESLARFILDDVLTLPHEVNGNVIKLFKYSRTFYHQSYYDRNPIAQRSSRRR